jgi:Flp pilus assembly protein TadG
MIYSLLWKAGRAMKKQRSERGQSLVELAVSLLVLLYLLSGAVEFGLAFFQYVQLRDAAQEGALYGSMNPHDQTSIVNRVRNASYSPIDLRQADSSLPGYVTVNVKAKDKDSGADIPVTGACEGDGVEVTVKFDHKVFMPFMSKFIGSTITLNATVTDTILTPPQTDPTCAP